MARSASKLGWVFAATLALFSGCTLEPGDPWGHVNFGLKVSFDPSARMDADTQRLRVGDGYQVALETISLELTSMSLQLRPDAANTEFDPANPPAGYSLCHNGHCHADDGRLVDYEDIALELANASGGGGLKVLQAIDASVDATASGTQAPLGLCANNCEAPQGTLSTLSVGVKSLTVKGRAFDTRGSRLPEEGVAFSWSLPVDGSIENLVQGAVDRTSDLYLDVNTTFAISDALLDGTDWTSISSDAAPSHLSARFLDTSALEVDLMFSATP